MSFRHVLVTFLKWLQWRLELGGLVPSLVDGPRAATLRIVNSMDHAYTITHAGFVRKNGEIKFIGPDDAFPETSSMLFPVRLKSHSVHEIELNGMALSQEEISACETCFVITEDGRHWDGPAIG